GMRRRCRWRRQGLSHPRSSRMFAVKVSCRNLQIRLDQPIDREPGHTMRRDTDITAIRSARITTDEPEKLRSGRQRLRHRDVTMYRFYALTFAQIRAQVKSDGIIVHDRG